MNTNEDLHDALVAAADASSPCQRVLRHYEDRQVAPRSEDFYTTLKQVDGLIVRVEGATSAQVPATADYRWAEGYLEYTTSADLDPELTGRDNFTQAVRVSTTVELRSSEESWFDDADDAAATVATDGGTPAGSPETWTFDWEPDAAAPYDGDHECQYDCDAVAEWVVELRAPGFTGGKVFFCCQSCSQTNRIYAKENELYKNDLSEDAVDVLPDGEWQYVRDDEEVATDGGVTVPEFSRPHEPAIDATCPDDLDGIDINQGEGCPHCGAEKDALIQHPAGHYHCQWCFAHWAGDRENATLHEEPARGPAVDTDDEVVTDGGETDAVVACQNCDGTVTETDAVYLGDGLSDDGLAALLSGDTTPVDEAVEFDDGPYCSVTCGIHGDGGDA